jgi:hypothetical protein
LYLSDGTSWNAVSGGGGGTDSYVVTTTTGVATNMTSSAFTRLPIAAFTEVSAPPPFQLNANGSVTCLITGHYVITASAALVNSLVANTRVQFNLNVGSHQSLGSGYAPWPNQSVTYGGLVTAGDVVELQAYIDSGSNQGQVFHFSAHRTAAGAQGPIGPQGPDVTLVQSNYWYGVLGGSPTAPGSDVAYLMGWTTTRSNGFSLANSNQRITPALAGKYKVTCTASWNGGGSAFQYTRVMIQHYNAGGISQSSPSVVGPGGPTGNYVEASIDAVFDMAVGDYLVLSCNIANTTGVPLAGSSFCSVVPVGGTKGDRGPSGGPVPVGGTSGQIIVKQSATDMDVAWANQPVPSGGAAGAVLTKYSAANFDTIWTLPKVVGGYTVHSQFSMGASVGVADNNLPTLTATVNGWAEVIISPIAFGFASGQLTTGMYAGLYSNSVTGVSGAMQVYTIPASTGPPASTWQMISGSLILVFPVTAGNSYVPTFRGAGPTNNPAMWWDYYASAKLYAN